MPLRSGVGGLCVGVQHKYTSNLLLAGDLAHVSRRRAYVRIFEAYTVTIEAASVRVFKIIPRHERRVSNANVPKIRHLLQRRFSCTVLGKTLPMGPGRRDELLGQEGIGSADALRVVLVRPGVAASLPLGKQAPLAPWHAASELVWVEVGMADRVGEGSREARGVDNIHELGGRPG